MIELGCLIIAVLCLAGWAWTLVSMHRAFLPYAQGLAALDTINAKMDERIKAVLANLGKRNQPQPESEKSRAGGEDDFMAEMQRKAQGMGFVMNRNGDLYPAESKNLPPMPDPPNLEIVDQ